MMTIKYSAVLIFVGMTISVHLINSVGGFFFISSEQQPTSSVEINDALGGSGNRTTMSMSSLSMKAEQFVLERRLADIERRLSSVEQPVWKIVMSDFRAWNLCSSEGLCRCLPALKQINCFRLSLKSVPATQSIPNDINHIDLSSNLLTTLHKDTFRGLTHLTLLDLSRNRLDFLPSDLLVDLDSLANLRLQENRIESVDGQLFMKLRSLTILDFSHNNLLSSLPSELFHSIYHIKVINLSHNRLNKLPRLQEQSEMEELDVSRNKLSAIESEDLMQLKSLKTLRLSENFIVKIASDAFDSLSMLQHLYLKKNFILHIDDRHFRNLKNLIILDLASNKIQKIHSNAFNMLTKVSELYLSQNSLNQIPENLFIAMKSLKRLMLFSNDFRYLHESSFIGLSSLTNLLLNNNNIKSFDAEVFAPLVNLTKLRLDSNKLQHLPKNCLDKLGKLMKIKLDKNPWHCDCASIYLARFLREHHKKLWNGNGGVPICLGPGVLGGKQVNILRFEQLCFGQWHSMLNLRLPVKKQASETQEPLSLFEKINLFRNITGHDKRVPVTEKPDFELVDEDSI